MKEIKFKAWDKVDKKMRTVTRITFGLAATGHPPIIVHLDDGTDNPVTRSIDKVELMQFTGLKDKNGKGISEGDVAEYKAWTGLDRGEIVWEEKECAVFWKGITDCQPLGDIYQDIKIIGNIYENPELLK